MAQSPFPGMDPYLESPDIWPDVHTRLASIFAEQLSPLLIPKYTAELDSQIVIDRVGEDMPLYQIGAVPDVAISETGISGGVGAAVAIPPAPIKVQIAIDVPVKVVTLHIRRRSDKRIVTAIEILSPINKRHGKERDKYIQKRVAYVQKAIHLVEFDLLRKWARMPFDTPLPKSDYLIMSRNAYTPMLEASAWALSISHALPVVPVPLLRPDPDVPLDVSAAMRTAYERARYDLRIDYSADPEPPLSPDEAKWAREILLKPA